MPMINDLAMNFTVFYFSFPNSFSVFRFLLLYLLASSCYIWKALHLCGVCSCWVERTSAIYPTLSELNDWTRKLRRLGGGLAFYLHPRTGQDMRIYTGYLRLLAYASKCSVVYFASFQLHSKTCVYMVTSSCVALLSMHILLFNGLQAASFYKLPIHPHGYRASSSLYLHPV